MPGSDSRAQAVFRERCRLGRTQLALSPESDAVRHKCGVMHSGRELNFTGAELIILAVCVMKATFNNDYHESTQWLNT